MNELVIGALVALDLTAAFFVPSLPYLTLQARYEGNDRNFVTLNCNVGGSGQVVGITSVKFFKRVPGGGAALLANWDPSAEQVVILDQHDTSITFHFSQTQEGYFRCQIDGSDIRSNEVGLAGSNLDNNTPLIHLYTCMYRATRAESPYWLARDGSDTTSIAFNIQKALGT